MKRKQTGTARAILEKYRSENFTGDKRSLSDSYYSAIDLLIDALETLKARRGFSNSGYLHTGRARVQIRNTPVAELEKVVNIMKRYAKKLRVAGEF